MAVQLSSFSNDILLHSNLSSNFPICCIVRPSAFIYTSFFITNILVLLPLCIFILYRGLQQWRKQSSSSAAAMMSHSDSFTYHMVTMELVGVFGFILCCCGVFMVHVNIFWVGYHLWSFTWYGETYFHMLTCAERYLAVVHPIIYLSLRNTRGIRIRNICNGCVWLSSLGSSLMALTSVSNEFQIFILFISLILIIFCSLSVLCVLIRPGPGDQGGERERVDQTKRRAFYTIVAILGVLTMRCMEDMIWSVLRLSEVHQCMITASLVWLSLPCTLVLPLLFLHRVGMFAWCRNLNEDKD